MKKSQCFGQDQKLCHQNILKKLLKGGGKCLIINSLFGITFYANDYCVPKVVMEAFDGDEQSKLENLEGILINGTGLLNVDKFCLKL